MNTWTSKVFFVVASLALVAGCTPMPDSAAADTSPATRSKAQLTTAELARGVVVNSPDGFCVDPDSLTKTFALMARCGALVEGAQSGDAPRAVITVSLPRMALSTELPSPEDLVDDAEALLNAQPGADLNLAQVAGIAPAEGLSGRYWRGAGKLGRNVVGLAIYPAAGGPDLDSDGARLLRQTFTRMKAQGSQRPAPPNQNPATDEKKGLGGLFAGLFQ